MRCIVLDNVDSAYDAPRAVISPKTSRTVNVRRPLRSPSADRADRADQYLVTARSGCCGTST